jgi:beta-lactamase regulating signal transducer with metallopeptidase domain
MSTEWMDRFVEFASAWLWLVLIATWRALPILIIVTGIGLALRKKLLPSLQALLLTLVLVRLLLPISIGSPMSLHTPIDNLFSSEAVDSSKPQPQIHDYAHSLLPNVDRDAAQADWVQVAASSTANSYTWEEILWTFTLFIMVSITIGLILRSIFSHIRFAIGLRSCRLLDERPLIDLLLRECDSFGVGRRPALREVPSLSAPAVFGLFRQTICLPPGLTEALSEKQLRWVIRHELAHIRRRDIPIVMLASVAGAFHWFNPIVWLIASRLRAAMEAAADRLALQSNSRSEVSEYGELLLRFAQGSMATKKSPTLGLISFASGSHLKQRVELLVRNRKPSGLLARLLAAGLVTAIAMLGLTDAREVSDQKMPEFHLVATDSIDLNVQPIWNDPFVAQENDGPSFVESYDVASIFETMPESFSGSNKSPEEQLESWLPLSPSLKAKVHIEGKTLSADLPVRQHQLLKQILDVWKNGEPGQISIEARIIRTNIKTASSIDWTGRRIEGLTVRGLGPAIAAHIDESELARLVRSVSEDRSDNILFAPKVTLFDGQTAGITDQVQRPFVTGVDLKADGVMQPVVSIVGEGLSFLLTPRSGDDNSVTLAFEVRASSIGKVSYANLPIKASVSAEPQFTVQVPATEQYAVSSSVKLSAGESVVVAIPRVFDNKPGADAETTVIVALTPRIINPEE